MSLALFLLLACGGTETPADGGGDAPTEAPAPKPEGGEAPAKYEKPEIESGMDICLGSIDCEAVQLSCCCGEGAVYVAVNKSRAEEAKTKYGQKDCGECPSGECTPPETECAGGCKLK